MSFRNTSESQKFSSDVIWVAISQVFILLTGLVTLPALTKSYSPETYGVWVQMLVTVGLLTPILTLQFATATVRFLAAGEGKEKRRHVFGTMLWPILAFVCLVFIVSLLLRQNLSIFLFASPRYISLVPLAFLWASTEALFSFSLSYLRARGKIKRLSVIQLALAIAKMAIIVSLVTTGHGLGWIVTFIIVGEALFIGTVFSMIIREIGFPKPAFEGLKHYLSFSIPQIPSGILLWIISASDRYFITHLLSLSHTGIYSASYTLGTLIALFYSPISFVLFPTVARLWEQKEPSRVRNYMEYSTKFFLTLAIPGTVGLYILSQPLLGILATTEYMAGGSLVLLVALGTILLGIYQMNVYIILLVQQTKWLPLMIGVAAVTNAGINLALIPKIGIMAAAISTIVSYFILATIVTVWARRTISYKVDLKFLSKVLGATLVMAFCLRFMPTASVYYVALAIIAGVAVFTLGLWLSKAFSTRDRRLIREVISGLNPRLWTPESPGQNPPTSNERDSAEQQGEDMGSEGNQ
ncbi:MAG: flippase [Dehalococcoidia bacterium]|nr:flippase [Dehalococcoidia bacterium]